MEAYLAWLAMGGKAGLTADHVGSGGKARQRGGKCGGQVVFDWMPHAPP